MHDRLLELEVIVYGIRLQTLENEFCSVLGVAVCAPFWSFHRMVHDTDLHMVV